MATYMDGMGPYIEYMGTYMDYMCRKQHRETAVHRFHSSAHIVVYATQKNLGRLHKGPRRGGEAVSTGQASA